MSGRKCTKGSSSINLIWGKSSVFSSKNKLLFVILEKSKINWDICAPCPVQLGYPGSKHRINPTQKDNFVKPSYQNRERALTNILGYKHLFSFTG